jgi:Flp pilus assembly protein TadG
MKQLPLLRRNERGAAVVELALAMPVLVSIIFGVFQLAMLYQANAGMQHALGEGARLATLFDPSTVNSVPEKMTVKLKISQKLFGEADGTFTVATPTVGTGYMDLQVTYTKKMNFLFMDGPTITLTRTKRAYTTMA